MGPTIEARPGGRWVIFMEEVPEILKEYYFRKCGGDL
jgi:hypothetical protein